MLTGANACAVPVAVSEESKLCPEGRPLEQQCHGRLSGNGSHWLLCKARIRTGAVSCLETPLRTDFRLPSQGCVLGASKAGGGRDASEAETNPVVASPALPSPPSDSSWQSFLGKASSPRSCQGYALWGGLSTDGHWDSGPERLWTAPDLQGSWSPVSSLCCHQQLCGWSLLRSPSAFMVPSQARCCATQLAMV